MIICLKNYLDCSPYGYHSNTPSIPYKDIIADFLQLLYDVFMLSPYLQIRVRLGEKNTQLAQSKIRFRRLVSKIRLVNKLFRTGMIAFLRV